MFTAEAMMTMTVESCNCWKSDDMEEQAEGRLVKLFLENRNEKSR